MCVFFRQGRYLLAKLQINYRIAAFRFLGQFNRNRSSSLSSNHCLPVKMTALWPPSVPDYKKSERPVLLSLGYTSLLLHCWGSHTSFFTCLNLFFLLPRYGWTLRQRLNRSSRLRCAITSPQWRCVKAGTPSPPALPPPAPPVPCFISRVTTLLTRTPVGLLTISPHPLHPASTTWDTSCRPPPAARVGLTTVPPTSPIKMISTKIIMLTTFTYPSALYSPLPQSMKPWRGSRRARTLGLAS